jgi:hypothetical protein
MPSSTSSSTTTTGEASFTIHRNSVSPWRIANCSITRPRFGKNEATGQSR